MEGLRSEWTAKAIVIVATTLVLFHRASSTTNHSVGGVSGWDLTSNLQVWTSEKTFHVGDSLVFFYTPVHDVVEVDVDDYQSCASSNPITTHNDGETVVPLTQPGTRFFICGHRGHCRMGLKLQVQVLASVDQIGPGVDSPPISDGPSVPEIPRGSDNDSAPAPSCQPRGCHVAAEFFYFVMAVVVSLSVQGLFGSVFGLFF